MSLDDGGPPPMGRQQLHSSSSPLSSATTFLLGLGILFDLGVVIAYWPVFVAAGCARRDRRPRRLGALAADARRRTARHLRAVRARAVVARLTGRDNPTAHAIKGRASRLRPGRGSPARRPMRRPRGSPPRGSPPLRGLGSRPQS